MQLNLNEGQQHLLVAKRTVRGSKLASPSVSRTPFIPVNSQGKKICGSDNLTEFDLVNNGFELQIQNQSIDGFCNQSLRGTPVPFLQVPVL